MFMSQEIKYAMGSGSFILLIFTNQVYRQALKALTRHAQQIVEKL